MANALYDSYRQQALQADCDLDDSIKVALIDHGTVTPNVATHDFYDDIVSALVGALSPALGSKTFTAGVFDAADVTLPTISGATVESVNLINDTPGTNATKDLIAYIDTATGLPLTPNGGDVTIVWDSGANRIFKL